MDRYVIRGGRQGYDRLLVLARDRWPDTSALLARAGIGPGMRCVDLGCGGGEVTLEMAKLVAPGGEVRGVDMDEVKLGLATQAAAERGVTNVEFVAKDVNVWDEPGSYDLVFCRFLLQHLSRPVDLLRRMWAAVKSGGSLVVEDADFGGWCCHPPNDAFNFFLHTYREVLRQRGGNDVIGRKLYRYFRDATIPEPHVTLVASVRTDGDAKALAWSTLDAVADAVISQGIASENELRTALTSLRHFTDDPTTLIAGPRIFQLWSRR